MSRLPLHRSWTSLRTLRPRALLTVAMTLAALCAALYVISSKALLSSALAAEERDTRRALEIFQDILTKEQQYFDRQFRDYSQWDDTQVFFRVPDAAARQAYIASNLGETAFRNYRVHAAIFADLAGSLVFGSVFDADRGVFEPVPQGLARRMRAGDLLFTADSPPDGLRAGLILLDDGPMMISVQPCANSQGKGPVAGTITWGRRLTDEEIRRMVEPVGLSVEVRRADDPGLPPDFQAARDALARGQPMFVKPISEDRIAGYLRIPDIDGRPALLARVDDERRIFQDARSTQRSSFAALFAVGLAFGAVLLLLLDRLVLARLARLSAEVGAIGEHGDVARRIALPGDDELSRLTSAINGMLTHVERNKAEQERDDEALARANERVAQELARSEDLLRVVLPEPISRRLKESPGTIAEHFEEATILFADLVSFTPLASRYPPADVVAWLDEVFSAFDEVAERHGLEKIKTIGDAYMAAAGVPLPTAEHAAKVAEMALDIRRAIQRVEGPNRAGFQLRIGFHTGPVVAGVIGAKKFIYDLWGDTVNLASRMESHGSPGRIQVTEAVYERLRDRYVFELRGPIEIKGRGPMVTYWLEGRLP